MRSFISLSVIIIAGCGGAGGSGSTSDPPDPVSNEPPSESSSVTVSTGVVTGFGSIFVNGVRYSTNGSEITTDEQRMGTTESALEVGMLVSVRGVIRDDRGIGDAHSIHYGDYIRGPVESIDPDMRSLTVMGMHVFLDDLTVMDGVDYHLAEDLPEGTLTNDMFVVVVGEMDDQGNLVADIVHTSDTRFQLDSGDWMMLAGVVDKVQSTSQFTINGQVCLIDGDVVHIIANSESEVIAPQLTLQFNRR